MTKAVSEESGLADFEYVGEDPYNKAAGELKLGSEGARFILPRKQRGRSYRAIFDVDWLDVISFECCEVNFCEDDKSWPLQEEPPEDYKIIGPAGMFFVFLMALGEAAFQIWAFTPCEEITTVGELAERYLKRPSLPGLAHHGTASAVRYIVDHCEILEQHKTQWHDWLRKGPTTKPRIKKFKERGPDYIFCKEGMAIDFYGAGVQLEQMSTFWPWRVINNIFVVGNEILYQWYEDSYTFKQQVWEDEKRESIYTAAENALDTYKSSKKVQELVLIRPWSFPSRFHQTWDKLEPFASKASRNSFPSIYDFEEEIE